MDESNGSYKERGVGDVAICVSKNDPRAIRILHRQIGTKRVLMNVKVFANMRVELVQDKFIRFGAVEQMNKVTTFLIKPVSMTADEKRRLQIVETGLNAQTLTVSDIAKRILKILVDVAKILADPKGQVSVPRHIVQHARESEVLREKKALELKEKLEANASNGASVFGGKSGIEEEEEEEVFYKGGGGASDEDGEGDE